MADDGTHQSMGPATPGAASPQSFSGSVVLIIPDGFDVNALAALFADLIKPAASSNRYIARVVEDKVARVVKAAWQPGCPIDILSNVDLRGLAGKGAKILRMPPGSTGEETDDLALAMTDAYLTEGALTELHARADQLGKINVSRDKLFAAIAPPDGRLLGLGRLYRPGARGPIAFVTRQVGRLERLITEWLAFWGALTQATADQLRGRPAHYPSVFGTAGKIRGALWPGWSRYSALSDELKRLCPDKSAVLPTARILKQFAELDEAASVGARCHRDIVWIAYGLSALAVCAALASWVELGDFPGWGVVELVALCLILLLIWRAHRTELQKRWMALRVGAEQLRAALLCVPLFIAPRVLTTSDRDSGVLDAQRRLMTFDAVALIKRVVRDQGIKPRDPGFSAMDAAAWVKIFVKGQADYHRDNEHTLEGVEHAVKTINIIVFLAVVMAVITHLALHGLGRPLLEKSVFFLFISAAGPAIAAALHGAISQLSIVDRKELSEQSANRLEELIRQLDELIEKRPSEDVAWPQVRRAARSAGLWMSAEADDWFKTMLLEELGLPA